VSVDPKLRNKMKKWNPLGSKSIFILENKGYLSGLARWGASGSPEENRRVPPSSVGATLTGLRGRDMVRRNGNG